MTAFVCGFTGCGKRAVSGLKSPDLNIHINVCPDHFEQLRGEPWDGVIRGQASLLDAQIAPPHNGTPTSVAAAVAATPRVGTDKRRILDLLARFENVGGLTQDNVSENFDMPRSTVAARMNELEREGHIKKNGDTRKSRYGGRCAVYVLALDASAPASGGTPR